MIDILNSLAVYSKDNPLLAFILICAVYYAVTSPFRFGFRAWNRYCRMRNIRDHGWPPAHLDADGDFKKEDK